QLDQPNIGVIDESAVIADVDIRIQIAKHRRSTKGRDWVRNTRGGRGSNSGVEYSLARDQQSKVRLPVQFETYIDPEIVGRATVVVDTDKGRVLDNARLRRVENGWRTAADGVVILAVLIIRNTIVRKEVRN